MKIRIAQAVTIATIAIEQMPLEDSIKKTMIEHMVAAFGDLTPWKVTGRRINGAQRYLIRDRVTEKWWCRRGNNEPVRYKSKISAQAMCDRLNMSRLNGNGPK